MNALLPGEVLLEGVCPYNRICDYRSSVSKNVELRFKRWLKSRLTLLPHEVLLPGKATYTTVNRLEPQSSHAAKDTCDKSESQKSILEEKIQDPNKKVKKPRKRRQRVTLKDPKWKKKTAKKISTPKKQLNGISHDGDEHMGQNISKNNVEDESVAKSVPADSDLIFRKPTSLPKKKEKKENQSKPNTKSERHQNNSLEATECQSNKNDAEATKKTRETRKKKNETVQTTPKIKKAVTNESTRGKKKPSSTSKTRQSSGKKWKNSVDAELSILMEASTTSSRRRTLYSPKSFELSPDMTRIFSDYVS